MVRLSLVLVWKQPATLLKNRLWHRCFPTNFAKFLRTPFLQNTSGQLFLLVLLVSNSGTRIFLFYATCHTQTVTLDMFDFRGWKTDPNLLVELVLQYRVIHVVDNQIWAKTASIYFWVFTVYFSDKIRGV